MMPVECGVAYTVIVMVATAVVAAAGMCLANETCELELHADCEAAMT